MPQIKYADMHCDSLTSPRGQVTADKLARAGCALQCFAYFADGGVPYREALEKFSLTAVDARFTRVRRLSSLKEALKSGRVGVALTVENLDWGGYMPDLSALKADGVIMASLVWNKPNILASPAYDGESFSRGGGGLTELGRYASARLDGEGIIQDISHLSDEGALAILDGRKVPLVASHSAAAGVFPHPRNLTDRILKKIADCGGAVGVPLYPAFLGGGNVAALACAHIAHIIKVAGEDVPALGTDFDGMIPSPQLPDCLGVSGLLRGLESAFGSRVAEKIALGNFARVLGEVCG